MAEAQTSHKLTKEELSRARRHMQQVKLAATQHRAATERQAERTKLRMAALTKLNLKALVPDVRVASPAFVTHARGENADAQSTQVRLDADKHRAALLASTLALQELALDAFTTLYEADVRLQHILDVERDPRASLRSSAGVRPPSAENDRPHLFPPLRPLVAEDTEDTHPARARLAELSRALQSHVAELSRQAAEHHFRGRASEGALPKRRRTLPTDADEDAVESTV